MQKNALIAIIAAVIVVTAGCVILLNPDKHGGDEKRDYTGRMLIYGNADNDDYIDNEDVKLIRDIIAKNSDDDPSNDIDWKTKYPLADATHDGVLDENDAIYTQYFADGKTPNGDKVKMWYHNFWDYDSYVNFPLGTKIAAEYCEVDLLCVTGSYEYWTGTDTTLKEKYGENKYPGIDKKTVIGTEGSLSSDIVNGLWQDGTMDTLLMWTGGQATDYLYSSLGPVADRVSIVMLPVQGKDCVMGALMFAAMLGDQSKSVAYVDWYDDALEKLDGVIKKIGEKKTVTFVRGFGKTTGDGAGSYGLYGSNQSPALWFNEVANFQTACVGKTGFTNVDGDTLRGYTDDIVVMFQRPDDVGYGDFNKFVEDKFESYFKYYSATQYRAEKIFAIEWEAMPFFSGPAGCYILACFLYPDSGLVLEDALAFLQTYLDNFARFQDVDAHYGFTYTGSGYVRE